MLSAGTKLGPYEILGAIGAGGMGEVYRARDSRLKRDVAVKVLPKAFSSDADRLRRFEQEALATAAMNHPNILAVFDIGTSEGAPYVVSELLEGETLRDRLRGGAIPIRKALDFALQIAHGLAAAHEKGIIHRDLKPENLFLTKDGRIKILDFGLAKLTQLDSSERPTLTTIGHATEAGVVLGTAAYMSPEQVRGQLLDARSDIFSFGAILYEMLSGKRAFHGDTAADVMSSILKEEPAELSTTNRSVSPALERIVHHCLEKNPEARFHSASDIAFDLEHLSGVSASSARAVPVPALRRRRGSGLAIAGALVLILVALGQRWLGHEFGSSSPPVYKQFAFRTGAIGNVRFAPDGSIVYSARWEDGGQQLYGNRQDDPSARELGLKDAELLSISRNGELAVRLHTVTVNGLSSAGTLARVPLSGGTPKEVLDNVMDADWDPNGENMVAAHFIPENGHWRLEYPVGKVLLDSIDWIGSPRISPDGKWIAFADHENTFGDDEGSVAVISSDGKGQEKKLSQGWEAVEGIVWPPAGDEIWFSSTMAGFAVNPHAVTLSGKLRSITNVPGGMWLQDVREGKTLAIANRWWHGFRVQAPGAKEERELGWFGWSVLADMSRDNRKILFFDVGEAGGPNYTVFLRDVDGSPPATIGEGKAGALSPDGKWIVTQSAKGGPLKLVPTGAGETRIFAHDSVNYNAARFLPDGKQLLVSGIEPGHGERDYLIDVATGVCKPITPDGTSGVQISPDGKAAAVRTPDGEWGVWPLDGSGLRPIPGLGPQYDVIQWSADGSEVYVAATQRERMAKIYRVNVATGKMVFWKELGTTGGVGYQYVDTALISADGSTYAYSYGNVTSQGYLVTGLK
jgi:Tol biopolymer transport system component